jgi:hypothetical protein
VRERRIVRRDRGRADANPRGELEHLSVVLHDLDAIEAQRRAEAELPEHRVVPGRSGVGDLSSQGSLP